MTRAMAAERIGETTRAWILRAGADNGARSPGELEQSTIELPPLSDGDVLVETLYGSWEGNMTHAVQRDPVDICRRLRQEFIVLGNSGVVRVLAAGPDVRGLAPGSLCLFAPIGKEDPYGYAETVCAYDEPRTMGVLAERFYVKPRQLIPVPANATFSPARWASFPVRYATAWSNWPSLK